MKMKRYFAADTRTALRELREDQGPDAVILSNKRVEGGVEIIAALDYEDSLEHSSLGSPAPMPKPERASRESYVEDVNTGMRAGVSHHYPLHDTDTADSATLHKITSQIQGLRNIMEAPMMQMAWGEMSRVQPLQANLFKQLMMLGLSARISKALTSKLADRGLTRNAWMDALKMLSSVIPVADSDLLETGGVISMVGPTGVGKTTTIAKLAARFALKHGRRQVSLITTDSYRIAAHEQLKTYGRILGVPVHVAMDADELESALKNIPHNSDSPHLTLIDTAGIGQADTRLAEHLSTLRATGCDIENYLVLSATGQLNQQDRVVQAFSEAGLKACILTKIDEATSLGEAISVLVQHGLPLAYVCDGQKVPDDLHRARGKGVVKQAVKLMKKASQSPSTEELAYSFGADTAGVVNV